MILSPVWFFFPGYFVPSSGVQQNRRIHVWRKSGIPVSCVRRSMCVLNSLIFIWRSMTWVVLLLLPTCLYFFLLVSTRCSGLHWNLGYKGKVEKEAENPYESSTSNDREKRENEGREKTVTAWKRDSFLLGFPSVIDCLGRRHTQENLKQVEKKRHEERHEERWETEKGKKPAPVVHSLDSPVETTFVLPLSSLSSLSSLSLWEFSREFFPLLSSSHRLIVILSLVHSPQESACTDQETGNMFYPESCSSFLFFFTAFFFSTISPDDPSELQSSSFFVSCFPHEVTATAGLIKENRHQKLTKKSNTESKKEDFWFKRQLKGQQRDNFWSHPWFYS